MLFSDILISLSAYLELNNKPGVISPHFTPSVSMFYTQSAVRSLYILTSLRIVGRSVASLRSEDVFPVVAALCLRRERSDDLKYVCALQAGAHRKRITNVFKQQFSSYFKAVGPKRFHFLFKILLPSRCIAKSIFSGF